MYIFDAMWKYATIIQCHFGRVANVHDASKTCSSLDMKVLRIQPISCEHLLC